MSSLGLSTNHSTNEVMLEQEKIPRSSLGSLPPSFPTLLQTLLEELVRHECAVRTALQHALKEQVDNGTDLASIEKKIMSTLNEDSASDVVKHEDAGSSDFEDKVSNVKLSETPNRSNEDLDSSHSRTVTQSVLPNSPHQGAAASPETFFRNPRAQEVAAARAKESTRSVSVYSQESALSGACCQVPSNSEVAAARAIVRAGSFTVGREKRRPRLRKLLQSVPCENITTCLILANAIMFGYCADYSVKHPTRNPPAILRSIDLFFVIVFTVEIALRIIAYGRSFTATSNPDVFWNIFDTSLVALALVEEVVFLTTAKTLDVSTLRLLRLLRLARIVRVIRLLRFFHHLRIMILGVVGSMKPFIWALLLLALITYVFSVVFLQFVSDELAKPVHKPAADKLYFNSLLRSMYSLYMCISGGISWTEVAEPLIEINPGLAPLFILYIAFSVFCVLNIVTGLFVERSSAMALEDSENVLMAEFDHRKKWISEIEKLFKQADTDGSGDIQWDEFRECMQDFRVQASMKKLGIDVDRMGPRQLWNALDCDSSGSLHISDFYGLQHLRGNARSIDVFKIRRQQKTCSRNIAELARMCQTNFERLVDQANFEQLADQVAAHVVKQLHETKTKELGRGIAVMRKLRNHTSTGHRSNNCEAGHAQLQQPCHSSL